MLAADAGGRTFFMTTMYEKERIRCAVSLFIFRCQETTSDIEITNLIQTSIEGITHF